MKGSQAHWTSELISLSAAACENLNHQVEEALDPHKHGGISTGMLWNTIFIIGYVYIGFTAKKTPSFSV
jgi:hypothetical protein